VNLLTPQDKRSDHPGDSKASALARRRLHERGATQPLLEALVTRLRDLHAAPATALLDVGAGEGFLLGELSRRLRLDGWGVDLSAAAMELAARRYPECRFIVANADRVLPFAAHTFPFLMSIDARQHPAEFKRLLAPGGALLLAVPGAEDLIELREAVLGEGLALPRVPKLVERFTPDFELVAELRVVHRARFDRSGLEDLLAATYRGARPSEQARLRQLTTLDVTSSHDVLTFRARST
jgi:23S rRNA (guanine745-N1)-methyltransferase